MYNIPMTWVRKQLGIMYKKLNIQEIKNLI